MMMMTMRAEFKLQTLFDVCDLHAHRTIGKRYVTRRASFAFLLVICVVVFFFSRWFSSKNFKTKCTLSTRDVYYFCFCCCCCCFSSILYNKNNTITQRYNLRACVRLYIHIYNSHTHMFHSFFCFSFFFSFVM